MTQHAATSDSEVTTLFTSHFSSVYSNLTILDSIPVTASDVNSVICSLDDSVKLGPDLIPPYFLNKSLRLLILCLLSLINLYLSTHFRKPGKQPIYIQYSRKGISRILRIISRSLFETVFQNYLTELS